MTSLFNYNTIIVQLLPATRSLKIELNRPEKKNAINSEMLFELESVFAWASAHLEINSLLLTGVGDIFSVGFDSEELEKFTDEKLQKLLTKIQYLTYAMFFLPQTVIVDLKQEAQGVALELAIGADYRLGSSNGKFQLNHLNNGMVPMSGGIGFLSAIIPPHFVRDWTLFPKPISNESLKASGFMNQLYDADSTSAPQIILQQVAKLPPIPRIQTKRSLLESILPALDRALDFEKRFAFAGLAMRDWEKIITARKNGDRPTFTPARELAAKLHEDQNRNTDLIS